MARLLGGSFCFYWISPILLCWILAPTKTTAFVVSQFGGHGIPLAVTSTSLLEASSSPSSPDASSSATVSVEMTESEQGVYNFFEKLHKSAYKFRIIVVGNTGGILETTSIMGPVFKTNTSPKSGKTLLTMASDDQTFEFHVTLAQVAKVAVVERKSPDGAKTLRVMRVLTAKDESVCSLILGEEESNDEAAAFFQELMDEYGPIHEF